MSRLTWPPLVAKPVDDIKKGWFSDSWNRWFNDLYNSLGARQGVGGHFLTVDISDISVATVKYIAVPKTSKVTQVQSCVQGTITGANETITIKNNANTSMGTITITNGSTAGTIDLLQPTSNNSFTSGDKLSITSNGDSGSAVSAIFTLTLEYT